MKKIVIIIFAGFVFSACVKTTPSGGQGDSRAPAADQKVGDTSKTGTITQSGSIFFINVVGQEPEIIESYAVELVNYVGQNITITGQYSGDTLFVGSVE